MSAVVRLDVARADTFVDVVGRASQRTRPVLTDHRDAQRRYLAAPTELRIVHPDRVGPASDDLRRLARLLSATARFADHLRGLDAAALAAVDAGVEARWHAEVVDTLDLRGHEWLRERVGDVLTWSGRISWLEDLSAGVADHLETAVFRVRTTLRRTTVLLDELVDGTVRRTLLELRELERLLELRPAVDATWLRRVGRASDWMGPAGDAVAGLFAGWEQWDEDELRDDLSSTERVARITGDAVVRGGTQFLVGFGTAAVVAPLVAAAPVTGGASLVAAGAVLVAGVAVGELADRGVDRLLDLAYEADGFEGIADWLDDRGRELRDVAVGAGAWADEQLGDLRDLAGVADRAWDDGVARGREVAADVLDGAVDLVVGGAADLGGHLGGLVGELPWP